jgi:hypothetical protein
MAAITSKFVALGLRKKGGLPPDGLECNCINDTRVSVLPLGVPAQAQIAWKNPLSETSRSASRRWRNIGRPDRAGLGRAFRSDVLGPEVGEDIFSGSASLH